MGAGSGAGLVVNFGGVVSGVVAWGLVIVGMVLLRVLIAGVVICGVLICGEVTVGVDRAGGTLVGISEFAGAVGILGPAEMIVAKPAGRDPWVAFTNLGNGPNVKLDPAASIDERTAEACDIIMDAAEAIATGVGVEALAAPEAVSQGKVTKTVVVSSTIHCQWMHDLVPQVIRYLECR